MKIYEKPQMQRLTWALLAGASALLFTAGLWLLLSHFQALAQPATANLEVQKEVNTTQARPGDTLTYTITVQNTGDTQTDAWLTDTLPTDELTYATGSLTATAGTFDVEAGEVITWTGSLTPLEVTTVTFAAQIASPLGEQTSFEITNTVEVTGAGTLVSDSVETTVVVTFEVRLPLVVYDYPPSPDLDDIPDPDTHNSFTVSWSSIAGIDRYVLQGSTDNFATVAEEWETTVASQLVEIGTGHGAYYFRVRADDDDRWGQGPWSEVKSVTLRVNYYDGFADSGSGWPTHQASCCLSDCDNGTVREHIDYKYNLYYGGGRYHVNVPKDCRADGNHGDTRHIYPVTLAPGIERPTSRTCIGMKGSFEVWDSWWSFWGIAFAVSNDRSTVYSLEVNNLGDWAIVKRTEYQYPGPNHPYLNEFRTMIVDWTNGHRWPANAGFTSNTLRAEIVGDQVTLYINGYEVYSLSKKDISSLRQVGIIGGDWEIAPTQIGYDYFYVDEGCDDY